MLGGVISCGQIRLNTAGFRHVCPGSKDSRAAGFVPERSQRGQSSLGPGEARHVSVPTPSMQA